MLSIRRFDVLIVYNDTHAVSAASRVYRGDCPFPSSSPSYIYNNAYAYFLKECKRRGLKAAFTTTHDVIGPGTCKSYWTYSEHQWSRTRSTAVANHIFDKFHAKSNKNKQIWKLLFSTPHVRPFNDPVLANIFNDKLLTSQVLADYVIPTVEVGSHSKAISSALYDLKELRASLPTSSDFTQSLILKDRFGAGGVNIYKLTSNLEQEIKTILKTHPQSEFVLQPYLDMAHPLDIRLIYQSGKLIQSYTRQASADNFLCNSHQGATSTYISKSDIPKQVIEYSTQIMRQLNFNQSLFTLDFAVSNSGRPYFLEGNISPGLYWDPNSQIEQKMSQYLINKIVNEFYQRVNVKRTRPQLVSQPIKAYILG